MKEFTKCYSPSCHPDLVLLARWRHNRHFLSSFLLNKGSVLLWYQRGKYCKGKVCPQWLPSLLTPAWLPNALLSRAETVKPLKRWTSSQFDCFWLNLGIQRSLGFPPLLLLRHRKQSRNYDRQMLDHQKTIWVWINRKWGKITTRGPN